MHSHNDSKQTMLTRHEFGDWGREFIRGRNYSYESYVRSTSFVKTSYPVDI